MIVSLARIARVAALGLTAVAISSAAFAADYTAGTLKIANPWTRVTPPGAKVAGGFLKVTNTGTAPDKLVSATSPVAGRMEVHEMALDGGIMKMRELANGLEIKPGATVELKPGSFHMMFMDLKAPIKDGDVVKGELVFEKAGKVAVEYKVEPLGSKGASSAGEHKHHGK